MSSAISVGSTTTVTQTSETTTPRSAPGYAHDESSEIGNDDSFTSSTALTGPGGSENEEETNYRLKLTNMELLKEITRLKTDKEFVWSLWKRLQVANPNIAAAMESVVAREREKAEAKDDKVLKILSIKDKRIGDLEEKVSTITAGLSAVENEKVEAEKRLEEARGCEAEAIKLKDGEINSLKESVGKLEREKIERETAIASIQEKVSGEMEEAQTQVRELAQRETALTRDAVQFSRAAVERKELIEKLEKENADLRSRLKVVEESETEAKTNCSEAKMLLQSFNDQRQKDKKLIEHKDRELESVRRELVQLWEKHKVEEEKSTSLKGIVTQLQKLQTNTQNVIKNQEVVFEADANNLKVNFESLKSEMKEKLESAAAECSRLRKENAELCEKIDDATRATKEKETQASMTSRQDRVSQASEAILECEFEMMQLKTEQLALKEKLEQRNKVISVMESTCYRVASKENEDPSVPPLSGKSKAAKKDSDLLKADDKLLVKLRQSQKLVEAKQDLLDAMESAHSSRLKRMEEMRAEMGKCATESLTAKGNVDFTGKMKEIVFLRAENVKIVKENIDLRERLDTSRVDLATKIVEINSHPFEIEELRDEFAEKIRGLELRATDEENLIKSREELRGRLKIAESDMKHSREAGKLGEAENEKLRSELHRAERCLHDLRYAHHKSTQEASQLRLELSENRKDVQKARTLLEGERAKGSELRDRVGILQRKVDETNAEWKRKIDEINGEWKRKLDEMERAREEKRSQHHPGESSATEDPTTESDADTLRHLKDSFQSAVARSIAKKGREKSDRASQRQKAAIRSRLLNLKRINATLKAEKEALRLKCNDSQSIASELQRRLNIREAEAASDVELKKKDLAKLTAELRELQQRDKDGKRLHLEMVDSLKSELSRCRALVKENESEKQRLAEELEALRDKLKILERDNFRKKTLTEDFKVKIKSVMLDRDEAVEASRLLEEKLGTSEEANKSMRKASESLKLKLKKLTEDLASKEAELQARRDEYRVKDIELKKATKKLKESDESLSELEEVARREMENLVETSECQLLALQTQVSVARKYRERVKGELILFVEFVSDMHKKVAVESMQTIPRVVPRPTVEDGMLGAAKCTAKEILQLSEDDIDDIMSCLSSEREERDVSGLCAETAKLDDKCAHWVAAVRRAVDSEDEASLHGLHYLLKSKLQEIVSCQVSNRDRPREKN